MRQKGFISIFWGLLFVVLDIRIGAIDLILLLNAMMIWAICSGIIALSLSLNQYDLMNIAQGRRALYMTLTVTGWALSIIWLIAPRLFQAVVAGVIVICALIGMIAVFLVMALMRRVANSL